MNDSVPSSPAISVKFSPAGRIHTYLLPDLIRHDPPGTGSQVVVRGPEGTGVGTVVRTLQTLSPRRTATEDDHTLVRRATRDDVLLKLKHQQRERDAHRFCLLKVRERSLPMKVTRVEQLFDGSKLVFYFTSDGRVDFRELVRDLAAEYRCRIEMRQIGVRDEARMLGGYGSCGRPLCCTTWLHQFEPVSIKMAKEQKLSLNPSKLSGLCGRLKCCLRYELPNAKGDRHAGCASEGSCAGHGCAGNGACGNGGCERCQT
ncbi:MAG: regulatory iron-sulfur-containing complex subunit RicT [Vicinamibacterales bacterium]